MGIPLPRQREFELLIMVGSLRSKRCMGRTENPTDRLEASRGHRHWAKEIGPNQPLFRVDHGVRPKNNWTEPALLEMSGYGGISNDADRFKRFHSLLFWCPRTHHSYGARVAPLWLRCFTCVTPTSSGRFRFIDSVWPTKHLFGHDRP